MCLTPLDMLLSANKQWGINNAGNNENEGESGWYAFPVNFNSACFALFCGLRNTDTNNPTKYDSELPYPHCTKRKDDKNAIKRKRRTYFY